MDKILTVIIPAYNIENFINKTLSSFADERFINDIEILIINDGSFDTTVEKAQTYIEQYPQSIRLISKENGGHGSVINVGVDIAEGKYFRVVDGDDYVIPDEMNKFVDQLKRLDADMFVSSYYTISQITGEKKIVSPNSYMLIENRKEISPDTIMDVDDVLPYIYASIHAVTFRTEIFRTNNIRMTEKTFYEDTEFVLYPIPYVSKIVLSSASVYVYRIDQASQSVSKNSSQRRIKELEKIVKKVSHYYSTLSNSVSKEKKGYILKALASQLFVVYSIYSGFDSDLLKRGRELKRFDKSIEDISQEIHDYADRYRLVRAMRMFNFSLYPIVVWGLRLFRK